MNFIDVIIILLLLYSIYNGYKKGLIWQLIMLAAILLGVFVAIRLSDFTGKLLNSIFIISPYRLRLAAFVVNLVIILILSQLGGFLVTKFMDASPLGIPNRIFGAFFSVIKTLLILSVVIVIMEKVSDKTRFISKEKTENSFLYKPLSIFAPAIYPYFETGITKTIEFNRQEKIIE